MSNLLSYASILNTRSQFRKSGTKSGGDFNLLDSPGLKYFKIFFYFNNGDSEGLTDVANSTGLLAPTWELDGLNDKTYYQYNSAWSYLKMNYEDERANLLKQFVNLLSNISSESPWYFAELSGLDTALERKVIMERDFKFEESRQKISIKCLSDAVDDRIGTLLDLYRSITWSWQMKREVLPANLRKFDMGILIYETPNIPFHKMTQSSILKDYEYAEIGEDNSSSYKTSYKYIEFHNCEFDYNSSKGNFSSINNAEGITPEYTIDILFDDCYEARYNEFILKSISDFIHIDTSIEGWDNFDDTIAPTTENLIDIEIPIKTPLEKRMTYFEKGFLENAVGQLANTAFDALKGTVKKLILGNLYSFSLAKAFGQVKSLAQGNVWTTARNVTEYVNNTNLKNGSSGQINSNIFSSSKKIQPKIQQIGNLYEANTIANNL